MSTNKKSMNEDSKNLKIDNNVESTLSKKIIDIKKYYQLYGKENSQNLKVDDLITFKEKNNGCEKNSITVENTHRKNGGSIIIVRKKKCDEKLNSMSINGYKKINDANYFNNSSLMKQNKSIMVKVHKKKNTNKKNNDGKILKYEIQEIIKRRCLGKKKIATKFN